MYLILFVLDNPDKLNQLLDAWEEAGTGGATVLARYDNGLRTP